MIVLKNKYHQAQANVTASFTLTRKLHPIRVEAGGEGEGYNNKQGPVVRTNVSANPGLNFNQGLFFFSSKALSQVIFYIFLEYPIIKL